MRDGTAGARSDWVLGVDFGGVIVTRRKGQREATLAVEDFLTVPPVDGAIEGLRRLAAERFGGRVFVVSKCRPDLEQKTLDWLHRWGLRGKTGLIAEVRFCRDKPAKGPICETLGITHFIDDSPEVLQALPKTIKKYLLNSQGRDPAEIRYRCGGATMVDSWQEIVADLLTPESPAGASRPRGRRKP